MMPIFSISSLGEGDHIGVGQLPQIVGLVAEVFESDPDVTRVGHQIRTPVIEDLHPAHHHVGLLDVDPVVGKQLRSERRFVVDLQSFQQQADGDEVAIHQPIAHFQTFFGTGASSERISSLIGMVEKK